jgi:hypothetical protein
LASQRLTAGDNEDCINELNNKLVAEGLAAEDSDKFVCNANLFKGPLSHRKPVKLFDFQNLHEWLA